MNHTILSGLVGIFLCSFGIAACAAGDVDDEADDELGAVQAAQAKDPAPSKEGQGCTASSTIRSTTVSNGTYTSNGSGGYNCCSSAGPNQVCINCDATGTNSCSDKAKTVGTTRPWIVAPIATTYYAAP